MSYTFEFVRLDTREFAWSVAQRRLVENPDQIRSGTERLHSGSDGNEVRNIHLLGDPARQPEQMWRGGGGGGGVVTRTTFLKQRRPHRRNRVYMVAYHTVSVHCGCSQRFGETLDLLKTEVTDVIPIDYILYRSPCENAGPQELLPRQERVAQSVLQDRQAGAEDIIIDVAKSAGNAVARV